MSDYCCEYSPCGRYVACRPRIQSTLRRRSRDPERVPDEFVDHTVALVPPPVLAPPVPRQVAVELGNGRMAVLTAAELREVEERRRSRLSSRELAREGAQTVSDPGPSSRIHRSER